MLNNRYHRREEPSAPAAYFVKTIIDAIRQGNTKLNIAPPLNFSSNTLPTIFMSLYLVITITTEGPATEKELRGMVIDACKRDGVKSTTRGTVAGKIHTYTRTPTLSPILDAHYLPCNILTSRCYLYHTHHIITLIPLLLNPPRVAPSQGSALRCLRCVECLP